MSKRVFTLIIIIILILLGGAYYWFFVRTPSLSINTNSGDVNSGNGIFGTSGGSGTNNTGSQNGASNASSTANAGTSTPVSNIPIIREISATPVGGMMSSSTATSTILRWIDRGTGHIYQAYSDTIATDEISDMTVPTIYDSYWNTASNAFIFQSLSDNNPTITTYYALLKAQATTSSSTTQFSLAGAPLSNSTLAVAVSPASKLVNQVFTLVGQSSGGSAGFISNFDGSKSTQLFTTPLTQLNAQWPTANTIALTTKGSATEPGYLYFVNTKSGTFNKIIGNLSGLSTLTNNDASEVLYSYASSNGNGITTGVYNLLTGQDQTLPFSTLAEKCVWSVAQKNQLYCAIPANIPSASYPDAWYQGSVSFSDSIWEIDTLTGDVHDLIDLSKNADVPIDAENLILSPDENFLYFINKKDLSLWSFDLNAI